MMGADILEEEGLVRLVESEENEKYLLELRCTLPDYLLSGVEHAFYVVAHKNPHKEKNEKGEEEEWWDRSAQSEDIGDEGELIKFVSFLKGFPKKFKDDFIKKIKDKKIDFNNPEKYYNKKGDALAYLTDVILQSKDVGRRCRSEEIMDHKIASLERRIIANMAKMKTEQSPIENLVAALCGAMKRSSEPASDFTIPICLCYRVALGYVSWRGFTPEEFESAPLRETMSFMMSGARPNFDAKRFEAFNNSMEYAILQNMFESLDFKNSKNLPAKEFADAYGHIGENYPSVPVLYQRFAEKFAEIYNIKKQPKPEAAETKETEQSAIPDWFLENK